MGRLIDADAWIKEFDEVITELEKLNTKESISREDYIKLVKIIKGSVEEQPTAYDIEKVVAELGELPNREADHYYANSNDVIDREDAIDIVRKGGVE